MSSLAEGEDKGHDPSPSIFRSHRQEEGGVRVMAMPETGADSDQQRRGRPTTTKGSWEGSAVFSLGVTASFLIKDTIGHNRVQNCIIVHGILHDLA